MPNWIQKVALEIAKTSYSGIKHHPFSPTKFVFTKFVCRITLKLNWRRDRRILLANGGMLWPVFFREFIVISETVHNFGYALIVVAYQMLNKIKNIWKKCNRCVRWYFHDKSGTDRESVLFIRIAFMIYVKTREFRTVCYFLLQNVENQYRLVLFL